MAKQKKTVEATVQAVINLEKTYIPALPTGPAR